MADGKALFSLAFFRFCESILVISSWLYCTFMELSPLCNVSRVISLFSVSLYLQILGEGIDTVNVWCTVVAKETNGRKQYLVGRSLLYFQVYALL